MDNNKSTPAIKCALELEGKHYPISPETAVELNRIFNSPEAENFSPEQINATLQAHIPAYKLAQQPIDSHHTGATQSRQYGDFEYQIALENLATFENALNDKLFSGIASVQEIERLHREFSATPPVQIIDTSNALPVSDLKLPDVLSTKPAHEILEYNGKEYDIPADKAEELRNRLEAATKQKLSVRATETIIRGYSTNITYSDAPLEIQHASPPPLPTEFSADTRIAEETIPLTLRFNGLDYAIDVPLSSLEQDRNLKEALTKTSGKAYHDLLEGSTKEIDFSAASKENYLGGAHGTGGIRKIESIRDKHGKAHYKITTTDSKEFVSSEIKRDGSARIPGSVPFMNSGEVKSGVAMGR